LLRARKPHTFRFRDDNLIPNHPKWPAVVYRTPVRLTDDVEPAAVFEDLFSRHGWRDAWRDGIYSYLHYHSRIHEVLAVARGTVRVRLGGPNGRVVALKTGDVVILSAGTGHQHLSASKDMLAVGAYPAVGTYDECRARTDDHRRALTSIPKVPPPRKDPVYGSDGPLCRLWQ
jgi:uncharacterized protein YjlB